MDRLENLKNIIMYLMADEHVSYQNGAPVSMNLRCDDTFVEDSHWHRQANATTTSSTRHPTNRFCSLSLA